MAPGVLRWRLDWPTSDKADEIKDTEERIVDPSDLHVVAFFSTDHDCENYPHANHQNSLVMFW